MNLNAPISGGLPAAALASPATDAEPLATQQPFLRALTEGLAQVSVAPLRQQFLAQNELLVVEDFLPPACLDALLASLPAVVDLLYTVLNPRLRHG